MELDKETQRGVRDPPGLGWILPFERARGESSQEQQKAKKKNHQGKARLDFHGAKHLPFQPSEQRGYIAHRASGRGLREVSL